MTYNLLLTNGTLDLQIEEGTTIVDHGIAFDGFQKPNYGERRSNAILHLLENFASEEDGGSPGNPPASVITNPLLGQFWFNKTAGSMRVWNGAAWVSVSSDIFTEGGPFTVLDGTPTNQLTMTKNGGADIIINNVASKNDFDGHVAGSSGAHASTAIVFDDTSVPFAAANAQEAVEDTQSILTSHLVSGTAHNATAIFFNDNLSISSDNVDLALEEIEGEVNSVSALAASAAANLAAHIADAVDAHDASAISYDNSTSGLPASFDVQVAIEELNNAVGGTANQSVIDSALMIRNTPQTGISSGVATKVGFNSVTFGDDFGQFDSVLSRYVATFDQTVRVRFAMAINSISDENRIEVQIRKNGVVERIVEEWKWTEDSDPPGDIECSCILELDDGDYVEGWFIRYGGGTVNVDVTTSRTQLQVDIIKARETIPPVSDVRVRDHNIVSSTTVAFAPITASVTVGNNGDLTSVGATSPAIQTDEWYLGNPIGGIGSLYQVRMVALSGTLSSGVVNTWQNLSTTRTYSVTQSVIGSNNFQGRLEIRDTATLTTQDTGNIDLTATVISK